MKQSNLKHWDSSDSKNQETEIFSEPIPLTLAESITFFIIAVPTPSEIAELVPTTISLP